MGYNKIVYEKEILLDLTNDTVTPQKLIRGATAHNRNGEAITGSCNFDADSSDATAVSENVLNGKTAYAKGCKITGTMPNRGSKGVSIETRDQVYAIEKGFYDGSGTVSIAGSERVKLISNNIRLGVNILGVNGTLKDINDAQTQIKTVVPIASPQSITVDSPYDFLWQVNVEAIPYKEVPNSSGGLTVSIG